MMNEEFQLNKNKRTARFLQGACGLLFVLFSFVYQFFFQHDVILLLHRSLSEGKTTYNMFWGSLSVTFLLWLFCTLLNRLNKFRGLIYSYSFFPAFLFLGVITDVGYAVAHGDGVAAYWSWLFPLLFVLWALLGKVLQGVLDYYQSLVETRALANVNLVVFSLFTFFTVLLGNHQIQFHHELAVEKALREDCIEKVHQVGVKQEDPSRTLTALKCYAFSRNHCLGDCVFDIPQLYGAYGLLIEEDDSKTLNVTADSLYTYLGSRMLEDESAMGYFHRLCIGEQGTHVVLDYYLCALLLEKKLDEFVKQFGSLYLETDAQTPRYYEEALFLYAQQHAEKETEVRKWSEGLLERWKSYEASKKQYAYTVGEANWMRREQGRTYWWYYEYR